MLMNQADSHFDRHQRGCYPDFFSVNIDLTIGSFFFAEKNFHQRRFPSAVFTRKRMDLTIVNTKCHTIICNDAIRIYFGDILQP